MRYVLLAALVLCGVAICAACTDARAAKPLGAPKHSCTICRGYPQTVRRWCPLVRELFGRNVRQRLHRSFSAAEARHALYIIWRESRGLPWVVNRSSGCTGLFQLLPGYSRGKYNLANPRSNVGLAAQLYCRRGWQPWAVY